MRITCLGASRCVTGSCFLLDNGEKYLIDCGLFQGGKRMEALNYNHWGFNPADVSAVFLTHAHIDHSGRIPKLVKEGFKGKIYATLPTIELCKILLLDSAHIQEMEAEWMTRKSRRRGERDMEPLYTVQDATAAFPLFVPVKRDEPFQADPELKVCFRNSGHILGSSILEVWSGDPAQSHKVVFSGDLGRKRQLIVEDPEPISDADTLFIESTYGNREHKSLEDSKRELIEAIRYSYGEREKVIIPAFAVERTQEVLYLLGELFRDKLIPHMPVYLDSPLAIAATDIFRRMRSYYDKETSEILESGADPFNFPELVLSRSSQESMDINRASGPAIIIAGNGMCTAGRVKHHLKHNLWRPGCSLVIVGYQAAGTVGRRLVEGVKSLNILGEKVVVRARIFTIGGLSAHADRTSLTDWLGHFKNPGMKIYVIHGEESTSVAFAEEIKQRLGFDAHVPCMGDVITPVSVKSTEPAIEVHGLKWKETLAAVSLKAEKIKETMERSIGLMPQSVLAQLERELAETEGRLDEILQDAMTEVRSECGVPQKEGPAADNDGPRPKAGR